jgi:Zn-dependent peptidase ImmA (M78 family)
MIVSQNNDELHLPRLTLRALQAKANEFLTKYHPTGTIPVPIEEIIDLQLDVSIIPVADLKRQFGVDAYLSHKAENIVIDQNTYDNNENRAKFSLAHEISHVILHREFYLANEIETPSAVLGFQMRMSDEDRKYMEIQAHTFAAHILMPPGKFKAFIATVEAETGLIANYTITDAAALIERLADKFDVSEQAVLKHTRLHSPELYKILDDARL